MGEHPAERIGAGLMAEMAADIADAQAAVGIAIVGVGFDRGGEPAWRSFQRAFGLLVGRRRGRIEVEREDQSLWRSGSSGRSASACR